MKPENNNYFQCEHLLQTFTITNIIILADNCVFLLLSAYAIDIPINMQVQLPNVAPITLSFYIKASSC